MAHVLDPCSEFRCVNLKKKKITLEYKEKTRFHQSAGVDFSKQEIAFFFCFLKEKSRKRNRCYLGSELIVS